MSGDTDGSYSRRSIVRLAGVGAGVALLGGTASARPGDGRGPQGNGRDESNGNGNGGGPPSCPACPAGTRSLAKFEFQGGEFVFEKGACEHVAVTGYESKPGEPNEPVEVTISAPVFVEDVIVKYGPNCVLASEADDVGFDNSDTKNDGERFGDRDEFEVTITVPADGPAISFFDLCAAVCYQVDLVIGEPIEDLQPGGGYGPDRRLAVLWGGSVHGVNEDHTRIEEGDDGVMATSIELVDGEVTATFDVDEEAPEGVTVSLVSYAASCPPEFDPATVSI